MWENALIIGASGGIGAALMQALERRGVTAKGLSRSVDGLDVTQEASVQRAFEGLQQEFDLIIVATGALALGAAEPEKSFKQLDAAAMQAQFAVNTIGPALVIKHAHRLLPRSRRAHLAVLSARVGSIGDNRLGGWYSYRAAKAAVNQITHSAAIELARSHKQLACVALHPGTVATKFTEKYLARHPSVPADQAAENLLGVLDGLGPEHTGRFIDWAGKEVPW